MRGKERQDDSNLREVLTGSNRDRKRLGSKATVRKNWGWGWGEGWRKVTGEVLAEDRGGAISPFL